MLSSSPPHTTLVILQKYLRANAGDLTKAKTQLLEALKWRKSYNPLAAKEEVFSKEKFAGLGYVTKVKGAKHGAQEAREGEDIVTFNIYGAAAKDPKKAFGDTDAFVRWRVALMELTLSHLDLNNATSEVPDYGQGPDVYQAIQVHDYLSVSFFRQPAEIKASSSKIIDLFQRYYPETVSYKYFVNVPIIMQWMMGAMKALMSSDSIQKMTWMSGANLEQYLGKDVPKEYNGTGPALEQSAWTVKYDDDAHAATATQPTAPTKTAEPAAQPSSTPKPAAVVEPTEPASKPAEPKAEPRPAA